jgi:hypothetical protein
LEAERKNELQQEEMKRGLMRGVCALNMEAMAVFRHSGAFDKGPSVDLSELQKSIETRKDASDVLFEATVVPKTALGPQPKTVKFADVKKQKILITRHN